MAATWLHQRRYEDYQPTSTAVATVTGFIASPDSPQFKAWLAHAKESGQQPLVRELQRRELEGRSFNFEAEWPRGKSHLKVVGQFRSG